MPILWLIGPDGGDCRVDAHRRARHRRGAGDSHYRGLIPACARGPWPRRAVQVSRTRRCGRRAAAATRCAVLAAASSTTVNRRARATLRDGPSGSARAAARAAPPSGERSASASAGATQRHERRRRRRAGERRDRDQRRRRSRVRTWRGTVSTSPDGSASRLLADGSGNGKRAAARAAARAPSRRPRRRRWLGRASRARCAACRASAAAARRVGEHELAQRLDALRDQVREQVAGHVVEAHRRHDRGAGGCAPRRRSARARAA